MAAWVSIRILNLLARITPSCPGRMKASYLARNRNRPRYVLISTAYLGSQKEGGMTHRLPHTTKPYNQAHGPFGESVSTRAPPALAGKVMQPYTAEGWQGATSTSLTALCALWNAAEVVALLCCLFLLRQQTSGTLGSGACCRTSRTPTARLRTHSTTCFGRIYRHSYNWHSSHDCHRAQSTHAASHAAATTSRILHEAVGVPFFVV